MAVKNRGWEREEQKREGGYTIKNPMLKNKTLPNIPIFPLWIGKL